MRKKRVVKKMLLGLYQPHVDYLERAADKGLEPSEIIRSLILAWGKEEFPEQPLYAQALAVRAKKIQKELKETEAFESVSNEDYAEKVLGGQVRGNRVYFRMGGGREWNTALETIKEKTAANDELIALHRSLLDRSFTYNGRVLDESEWRDIWDGWSDKRPAWFELRDNGQWPLRADGSVPEPGERNLSESYGISPDELEV